jgi:hypothetical protein
VQGFEIVDAFSTTQTNGAGMELWGLSHTTIRDNHIHSIGNYASNSGNGICGVFEDEYCSYITYDSNVIHDNYRSSGQYVNHDHGIYTCGDYDTITNNVIYNHDKGYGVQIAGSYDTVDGLLLSNNTFANGVNRAHIVVWGRVINTTIQNNIFYNIPSGCTAIEFTSAKRNDNDLIRYNLTYGGNGIGPSNRGWTYSNNSTGDPLFVDATNYDFHLTSSSPAKDAGTSSSAPSMDCDGLTRPYNSLYDMGAFEYAGG